MGMFIVKPGLTVVGFINGRRVVPGGPPFRWEGKKASWMEEWTPPADESQVADEGFEEPITFGVDGETEAAADDVEHMTPEQLRSLIESRGGKPRANQGRTALLKMLAELDDEDVADPEE